MEEPNGGTYWFSLSADFIRGSGTTNWRPMWGLRSGKGQGGGRSQDSVVSSALAGGDLRPRRTVTSTNGEGICEAKPAQAAEADTSSGARISPNGEIPRPDTPRFHGNPPRGGFQESGTAHSGSPRTESRAGSFDGVVTLQRELPRVVSPFGDAPRSLENEPITILSPGSTRQEAMGSAKTARRWLQGAMAGRARPIKDSPPEWPNQAAGFTQVNLAGSVAHAVDLRVDTHTPMEVEYALEEGDEYAKAIPSRMVPLHAGGDNLIRNVPKVQVVTGGKQAPLGACNHRPT